MAKSDVWKNELLLLYFNNVDAAGIGDAAGLQNSAAAGSAHVSLHTASPGGGGTQNTNQVTYTGSARVAVARSSAGWTVTASAAANTGATTFPTCTGGGPQTAFFWGIGDDASGAGKLRYYGPIGAQAPEIFTAATNDNITIPGHTLVVDDRIVFRPISVDVFPTGITEGTLYWVKTSATDVITISATQGGATVDITAVGAGLAQKVTGLTIDVNITPSFAAGTLIVRE